MNSQRYRQFLVITLLLPFFNLAYAQNEKWSNDYEPFRIAGNIYYVGTEDLACYLITSNDGHILINTGLGASADMIRRHVEKLGFRFSDIKILLTNQAHYDHVGAMAAVQHATGARMFIDEKDAEVMADGGNSDYLFGGKGKVFEPLKADRLLHNNDTIMIGGNVLTILHHPGHTKGSASHLVNVSDEKRKYKVLIANIPTIIVNSLNIPAYPDMIRDYTYTLKEMKKIQFDIWLAAHASQFSLQAKHHPGDPYRPETFFDRKGYDKALADVEKQFRKKTAGK